MCTEKPHRLTRSKHTRFVFVRTTAVRDLKAVSDYFTGKQILPFGFAMRCSYNVFQTPEDTLPGAIMKRLELFV